MTVAENMSRIGNNLFVLLVLLVFFFIIYTRMKKQSAKDTFQQIKEMFGGE